MARPARRSVGSDQSLPTTTTTTTKSQANLNSTLPDPLRISENITTTTHAIPKFNNSTTNRTTTATPKPHTNSIQPANDAPSLKNETSPENNATALAAERAKIRMEFYATYDVMTGVRIAATLGGFFGLMVFLVIYKSRSHSGNPLKSMKKNPTLAAQAAIVMQVEEQRELEEAWQATSRFFLPDEGSFQTLGYKRDRMLSLGNISAPPALHRGFRFSSFAGGYSSLIDPPRRYSYSGGRRKSTSESSRILSAYPMGDSFGTDDFIDESDDEEGEDNFDQGTTTAEIGYHNFLNVPGTGQESRRSSDITCCSTESSYLERRCSAITLGLTPLPPISSRNPSRRPSRENPPEYYPNIQVIQPTPKTSPHPSEGNIFEKTSAKNGKPKYYEPADSFDYITEYPDEINHSENYLRNPLTKQLSKLDDTSITIDTTYSSHKPKRKAPLASLSSFKISSADYQDSDLRSLGSDSVFAESYADTDEDMQQFSTDSDETSDPKSPKIRKLNKQHTTCSDITENLIPPHDPTEPNEINQLINEQNDFWNSSNVNNDSNLGFLNKSKSNSMNLLKTFETTATIERQQQNDKKIKNTRPASYSGCTNISCSKNNDNYDNNNSDDTKSSECVDIDVRLVDNNRKTISPSVILELPVLSTNQEQLVNNDKVIKEYETIQLDPSIPGPSRKWSKETLF